MLCVTTAAGWQQKGSNKSKSFPLVNIVLEKQFMKGVLDIFVKVTPVLQQPISCNCECKG